MTLTTPPRTLLDEPLILDEVAENQWRVLDVNVPEDTAASIVGFVCVVAGVYEVTSLRRPLEVTFCTDLTAAQIAILDMQ